MVEKPLETSLNIDKTILTMSHSLFSLDYCVSSAEFIINIICNVSPCLAFNAFIGDNFNNFNNFCLCAAFTAQCLQILWYNTCILTIALRNGQLEGPNKIQRWFSWKRWGVLRAVRIKAVPHTSRRVLSLVASAGSLKELPSSHLTSKRFTAGDLVMSQGLNAVHQKRRQTGSSIYLWSLKLGLGSGCLSSRREVSDWVVQRP